ncbi:MAG: hypothetical protein NTW90_02970 [Nitrosospira sp.]|nr:hypothetical protein [Nitrosospira sp.]
MTTPRYTLTLDSNLALLVNALDDGAREFYEERAAILEYDGGYPRRKAESLAWEETQRYLKRRHGSRG